MEESPLFCAYLYEQDCGTTAANFTQRHNKEFFFLQPSEESEVGTPDGRRVQVPSIRPTYQAGPPHIDAVVSDYTEMPLWYLAPSSAEREYHQHTPGS